MEGVSPDPSWTPAVGTNARAYVNEALDSATVDAGTAYITRAGSTTQISAAVSYYVPLIADYSLSD